MIYKSKVEVELPVTGTGAAEVEAVAFGVAEGVEVALGVAVGVMVGVAVGASD